MFYNIVVFTIFEEMLFRGLIFNELRKVMPLTVAVIIQALPAAFQSDMMLSVFGYISMVIYCLAYICSDSIWGSITVLYTSHIFVMLTRRAGIDSYLQSVGDFVLIIGMCVSAIITCLIYFIWISKNLKKKGYDSNGLIGMQI
ncbi:CPBP family intramembrane metalloprotease [Ruminiclostridium herbifermentans]|uniref:CPBP family intramembrane metalloprotease n=2 Tax=Ruminiclostridium herbifermentans TaxID=2488810 RepID=A0A7H1VS70_9FIRM|nr:CPBP family intramembrane metalloprotease [Ruminiclostridium herbifermentans]